MISDTWSLFLGAFVFFAVAFGVYGILEAIFMKIRRNRKQRENEQSKN